MIAFIIITIIMRIINDNFYFYEDVYLAVFRYLVVSRMPDERYRRRLGSLLCLCDVHRSLIISLVCCYRYKNVSLKVKVSK